MANLALVTGNAQYTKQQRLECCSRDVAAIAQLLMATQKYDTVEILEDLTASDFKDNIRSIVDRFPNLDEIFFYFSGHGYQTDGEFYYCATDFDANRPNETGLSNSDLHVLLKATDAGLVVKVIDACSSGTLLVKSDGSFIGNQKSSFRNLIQIASCLDSQTSLTGDPLSPFTSQFRKAALSKTEGTVFYSDIVAVVRDAFIDNSRQTPHFVSQGTGREQFVSDAHVLDELRQADEQQEQNSREPQAAEDDETPELSLLDRLTIAEERFASAEKAQIYIDKIFSEIEEFLEEDSTYRDFFAVEISKHSDFIEPTTRNFIVRILSREDRPDQFVTAAVERKKLRQIGYSSALERALGGMYGDEYYDDYELSLNAKMERVQLRINFDPKFKSLPRFTLVISCAPSLESCFVFEYLTRHSLVDWEKFNTEGADVKKRWFNLFWDEPNQDVSRQIVENCREVISTCLNAAAEFD